MFSFTIGNQLYAQTEQEVYCYILAIGIKHPEIVLKQAIYETGHFRSNIFNKRNNLFGFRQRKYIYFDSWKSCIDYYKVWQEKHYSARNRLLYVSQLKKTRIKAKPNCLVDEKK
jgi:hypothetical protein